ncbi:MAG TPA: hypothetical protein VLB80_03510 [Candidatus Babeliales bacterium]|nr:hypothetical protein [Candidatus Babeliales bacterium]
MPYKITLLFFILFIGKITLSITTNPLPLSLNLAYDPYWTEDAQEANNNINHFIEPADDINYTNYRYVGIHNGHVYPRFFKIIRQQDQTIIGNLSYGVRGLMLDTYNWSFPWFSTLQGPKNAKVCLSHTPPGIIAFMQKATFVYQTMKYELRRIIEFMKINEQAVITIILEDYAHAIQTAQEIKEVMIEAQYDPLFKPNDLINEQWPTLGWMRHNNKRLIIFTQRAHTTDVTFNQFNYMAENQYSTTNEKKLCTLRQESPLTSSLYAFNNFSGIPLTLPTIITKNQVDYITVKRIIKNCVIKKLAGGKIFNGYWADHIINSCNYLYAQEKKTIFEYVNELNAHSNKTIP